MESLFQNLKEQVTCSICLDTFTKPKTIACLHTFCFECLEKHALASQRQGKFRCPECQAEVDIPEGNLFDNLPTSFLHNGLLNLLTVRQSGDGSQISCGICKKTSAETSYCFDCQKMLCPDCVKAHEVFQAAAFEGHKVTPVTQFQAQDYQALLKRQSFCLQQYHDKEVMRFFCLDCQSCVCQVCLVTDHKNHNVDLLEKAVDSGKAKIMAKIELLKEKRNAYIDLMHEVEKATSELDSNITTAISEVSQVADQMIARIREHEQKAVTELRNTGVSRMEKLDCFTNQIQSSTKQIDQAVEFASNLLQRCSSSDILQSKKNLEQRFADLNKPPVPALPVSSFVKFVTTIAPESFSLGFIATSETDVRLSTIEVLTENIQAGLEAEFHVCREKSKEKLTSETQCNFHVKVLMEPAEQEGSLTICRKENGNFQVKFIPKVQGTYNITVKINGSKLANSPFTIQVKERQLDVVGEFSFKGEMPQDPSGIAVNSKGLIAIADKERHCVLIFDKEGQFVRRLGCFGENRGRLKSPSGVTYLNDDEILVASNSNHRIQKFNIETGKCMKSFGKCGTEGGQFNAVSICVDGKGQVIVADFNNKRMQVLTNDSKLVFTFGDSGSSLLSQHTSCIYHKNMFIVSYCWEHCLKVFGSSGHLLYTIGENGEADGQLSQPWGLCVEQYGNRQNLLVCDGNNGRIQQFTVEGCFTGKTVTVLPRPMYIATTPDGRILVSDIKTKKIHVLK